VRRKRNDCPPNDPRRMGQPQRRKPRERGTAGSATSRPSLGAMDQRFRTEQGVIVAIGDERSWQVGAAGDVGRARGKRGAESGGN